MKSAQTAVPVRKSNSRKPAAKPIAALETPAAARSAMGDFTKQAMASPQAPEVTESPEFKAALQAALAAALTNRPAKAAKEPKAPRIQAEQKNGVSRPGENTLCGKIFAAADAITVKNGSPATIAQVKVACHGTNDHTVKTQYARWRTYNGVTGRVTAPADISPTVAE